MSRNQPPCGLTRIELDGKGWVDASQCTALYEDSNGIERICGRLYTSHPSAPDFLSMSSVEVALPPTPPKAIKPENLNGEMLYEREEASKRIVDLFLSSSGEKLTPICDDCFGAGKTSLMYKFRNVLTNLEQWPEGSEGLQNAVYIHVRMDYEYTMRSDLNFADPDSIDIMLLGIFSVKFSESFGGRRLDRSSRLNFIESVNELAQGVKFFVHIDEVGSFEQYAEGKNVLYRILHFGEAFRSTGHYYAVTGRSRYLHTIGLNFTAGQCGPFSSPCRTVLIPLPLLSISSIIAMFKENKLKLASHLFGPDGEPDAKIVNHIHLYSSGVPRAVYLALRCYKEDSRCTPERVEQVILERCGITLQSTDVGIFNFCIELSWSQIRFTNMSKLNGEPITEIIARLGIYRDNFDADGSFTLQIPYFSAVSSELSPTLLQTAKLPDRGDRFEVCFRRIYHLRASLGFNDWTGFGLPILAQHDVPFPSQLFKTSLPFPKIAQNGSNDISCARSCMEAIHSNRNNISNSIFAAECLPELCSRMEIGRYYHPFGKSASADAMIRCDDRALLCFQFGNYQRPFRPIDFHDEMKKCILSGWSVTVVLVCASGYENNNAVDSTFAEIRCLEEEPDVQGVKGIFLSSSSVRNFVG